MKPGVPQSLRDEVVKPELRDAQQPLPAKILELSDLPGSNRRPQDDQVSITVSRSSN